LQTGEDVEPAHTGRFTEFLDMTPFASEQDRATFVAWCLASVLPLEYSTSPLFVCYADGQEAGKTWLIHTLAWALGYRKTRAMKLEKSNSRFGRNTIAAMKAGRMLLWDNVVGSGFSFIEHNGLSELLTTSYAECPALWRVGTDEVRNRHLFGMTMNSGRLCEDLASRAISCKLVYDPSHPGILKRGTYGESYWERPEVSREVLAEILWRAQTAFSQAHEVDLNKCRRPQEWHRLVQRMGLTVPTCAGKIREAGDYDIEVLRKIMGEREWQMGELCEALHGAGQAGALGLAGALGRAAVGGPAVLGLFLTRARECGLPLTKRKAHGLMVWRLNEEQTQ
jgi:hypothetical protein